MARRLAASEVTLRPVTVGRHLAVRAATGCAYVEGEGGDGPPPEIEALPDAALLSLIDHAVKDPPREFADRAALVALATAVFAAWSREAERHVALGLARARLVRQHTGCGTPAAPTIGGAPPPEMLPGALSLAEWAAVRRLPLWEVVMQSAASDAVALFRKRLESN